VQSDDFFFFLQTFRFSLIYSIPLHLQTRETPRKFGTQFRASLGNRSSSQSSAKKEYTSSSRFASATTGNEKNADDATYRNIHNSNSKIQVNGNSIGHPPSNNNNINSTSTHLSNLHRVVEKSPSYINITLTTVESDNILKVGENYLKWGFVVVRQLTFVQNTFSDVMPNAYVEHGHGSTLLYKEEEIVKEMDSCSDTQSNIAVNGYPATKEMDELVVSIVQHGSPAHYAGLVEGDIVDSVYGQKDPTLSLLFGIMRDSTRFVVKVKRMESSFERGFREKETEYVPVAVVSERILGESFQRCDDGPGRLEVHNDLEKNLVRPLDGDNDQITLSAFMDNDDLLDNDIALAMASAPQSITDANAKFRLGVDINQAAGKAVQAADDSDDGRKRQVASFDRIHAGVEKNDIEESPCLDKTDVQEESLSKEHDLLHYGFDVVDEEISSFDQSDVEPATDYQFQSDCGSSTNDSDDQKREEPFRDSPTVQTIDKSSNNYSRSDRRGEDDVREEESLLTAKRSITSESEKGESVVVPPRQKKSKLKNKKRKVSEHSTLSKQEKISKCKRKKERCQGEDEMVNKDTKQNEKKKRKRKRTASYYHLGVLPGTNVINANANVNDNGDAHEEVLGQHTIAATELVEEGSITDKDGNVNSLEGMPVLHNPPAVNSKRKHNQAYESFHEKWNRLFMELKEYKEKNGHCNMPTKMGVLGRWIRHQRTVFRSNKLKADRYEKLMGIGFVFEDVRFASNGNAHEDVVEEHTIAATRIVEEEGITDINGNVTSLEGMPALHNPPPMNSKRKEIGANVENWDRHFMELVEYKEKNGHCNIPTNKGSLGNWIELQRKLFRSKKLKADRYENLVGIGFVFEDVRWNYFFMELVKYKETNGHGHCFEVPKTLPLGQWIERQRKLFRSKKLTVDRYDKLVGVGIAFEDAPALENKEKLDQQWQEMYQKLLEHKEMKGHCFNVPQTLPLGTWLRWQRWLYRNGNLREDRADQLLSVGFDDKHILKKGGAIGVRDATSGQPPRKKRKVLGLDNDLAAITHDEGEEGIVDINANGDGSDNDNGNAHEEIVEEHTFTATEQVEVGIKEGQK